MKKLKIAVNYQQFLLFFAIIKQQNGILLFNRNHWNCAVAVEKNDWSDRLTGIH
jgi:hypothetical protein